MNEADAHNLFGSEPAEAYDAALRDEANPLLPIWAKQIETARDQTEVAVVALTARFAAVVERIDAALGTNDAAAGRADRAAEVQRNESDLEQVVAALKAIQQSRNQLAHEIRSLTAYTDELQQLASEVDWCVGQGPLTRNQTKPCSMRLRDSGRAGSCSLSFRTNPYRAVGPRPHWAPITLMGSQPWLRERPP